MERRDAACFGASVTGAALVTAGFAWPAVLLGWGIGAAMLRLLPTEARNWGRPAAAALVLGGVPVLAAVLLGADGAFPEDSTFPFVSAALLGLLWLAMCARRQAMGQVANILGMLLLPVVAVLVLFGLGDVQWREIGPALPRWRQVWVSASVTCPWWALRRGPRTRETWAWFGAAAGIGTGLSLLTYGILGQSLAAAETEPLYRAVQTIRILGVLQRLESLLAAAVLLGAFGLMLLTAERMAEALDILLPRSPARWKGGPALLAAFALEWAVRTLPEEIALHVEAAFWGALPFFALGVVALTKKGKKA